MRAVDVRPARPGAVVVTVIAGAGKESQSPPAEPGDMWCATLPGDRQGGDPRARRQARRALRGADRTGQCRLADKSPRAIEMRHFGVRESDGRFSFTAPWGEPMVARPGDAIVRDPCDPADTFRIAAAALRVRCETPRPAS
jgi:hypothetical protein